MATEAKGRISKAAVEVVDTATLLLLPINPRWWPLMGVAFAKAPGWMPTMLLIAMFGMTFFLSSAFQWAFGPRLAAILSCLSWITWLAICMIAIACSIGRSFRQIRRMGLAVLRPRWWFEVVFFTWNVFFIWNATLFAASFALDSLGNQPASNVVWRSIGLTLTPFALVLALAAVFSLAMSVVRRKLLLTSASSCVYFYVSVFMGGSLIGIALDAWSIPSTPAQKLVATLLGILGLALMIGLQAAGVAQWNRWEKRLELNRQLNR